MAAFPPYGPRAVIFDVDGTLVDTEDLIFRGTRHTIRTHLTREFRDDELWALYGKPVREIWHALSPEHVDALHETYLEFYLRHRLEFVRAFPGIQETVDALARRGVRLGILSNKLRSTGLPELETAGLDGAFEVLAFVEDLPEPKPDPRGLLAVLEQMGVAPGEAVYVGDSWMDILCGKGAGVPTCAALWAGLARRQHAELAQLGPDFLFKQPQDILTLFPAE